jgi:flagellar motor switch protein FliN/FliY
MAASLNSILKIEVPVIVQIASRVMPMKEVMSLEPGAIIELPKLADEELELEVGDKQIGLGLAVKVGENFGVRVTYVGDIRQRIANLGGDGAPTANAAAAAEQEIEALAEQLMAGNG